MVMFEYVSFWLCSYHIDDIGMLWVCYVYNMGVRERRQAVAVIATTPVATATNCEPYTERDQH